MLRTGISNQHSDRRIELMCDSTEDVLSLSMDPIENRPGPCQSALPA